MKISSLTFAFLLITFAFTNLKLEAAPVQYKISFHAPQTHYISVEMEVDVPAKADFYMPVWTPGSYLVREFSRHVEGFEVRTSSGEILPWIKSSKNHWQLQNSGKARVRVSYQVYAFEYSVRTSFVDVDHANLNGASVFIILKGAESKAIELTVVPAPQWKVISTPLIPVSAMNVWKVKAENYDELIDSPIEIGNQRIVSFTAAGVPHELVMINAGAYNEEQLKSDFTRIIEESAKIFGPHPCKRYLFFVQHLSVGNGGGGLEHANASTLQTNQSVYANQNAYNAFLGLVAHEYFHLWNVKRLKPVNLGPFNYDEENYSDMLFFAEGFTAYYEDLIPLRCGILKQEQFLGELAGRLNSLDNTPGNRFHSVADAGLEAWIKYYRSNENSANATISYYNKGAVIGALLDLKLLAYTDGQRGLDSLMRYMYTKHHLQLGKGYSMQDFRDACKHIAGRSMDDLIDAWIMKPGDIDFTPIIALAGIQVINLNENQHIPWLGINTNYTNSKLVVKSIDRNSPAWNTDVNVNDELIAINNIRIEDDLSKLIAVLKPESTVELLVSRAGQLRTVSMKVGEDPKKKYLLEQSKSLTESQSTIQKRWLQLK